MHAIYMASIIKFMNASNNIYRCDKDIMYVASICLHVATISIYVTFIREIHRLCMGYQYLWTLHSDFCMSRV